MDACGGEAEDLAPGGLRGDDDDGGRAECPTRPPYAEGPASEDPPGAGPSRTPRRRPRPARDLGGYRAFAADAEPSWTRLAASVPAGYPCLSGDRDQLDSYMTRAFGSLCDAAN